LVGGGVVCAAEVVVLRVVLGAGLLEEVVVGVGLGLAPPPPGAVAEAVAVTADVLCTIELAAPAMSAGPGTG